MRKSYEEIVRETMQLLEENEEWITRYQDYLVKLQPEGRPYKAIQLLDKKFQPEFPLVKYNTIHDVKRIKEVVKFDIRFWGCSIGVITVKIGKKPLEELDVDDVCNKATIKFDINALQSTKKFIAEDNSLKQLYEELVNQIAAEEGKHYNWRQSEECKRYRVLVKRLKEEKALLLENEHAVETTLLYELAKTSGINKGIKGIQPHRICGKNFYQLKTVLGASEAKTGKIKYSGRSGGGIDILAKKNYGFRSELCVIELKDNYLRSERPTKAVSQGICYATFLIQLIRKANTENLNWYKDIFEMNEPLDKPITVNVVVAMPYPEGISSWEELSEEDRKLSEHEPISVGGDFIKLHTLFFDGVKYDADGEISMCNMCSSL